MGAPPLGKPIRRPWFSFFWFLAGDSKEVSPRPHTGTLTGQAPYPALKLGRPALLSLEISVSYLLAVCVWYPQSQHLNPVWGEDISCTFRVVTKKSESDKGKIIIRKPRNVPLHSQLSIMSQTRRYHQEQKTYKIAIN